MSGRDLCDEQSWVALLAEGVDRNYWMVSDYATAKVALLAEGVDRNRLKCRVITMA